MSQTIAVPERLAARLEQKAQWQRTTVESLVVTILDAAVGPDDLGDDWSAKNARRVALIHQRFALTTRACLSSRRWRRIRGIADRTRRDPDEFPGWSGQRTSFGVPVRSEPSVPAAI